MFPDRRQLRVIVREYIHHNTTDVLFVCFSSSSAAAVFHPSAHYGESKSRRKHQHTVCGRRFADAVRKMAPRKDNGTLAGRQTARGPERVELDKR